MGRVPLLVAILVSLSASAASAETPFFNVARLYSEAEFTAAIKPYTDGIARNANDAEAHRWLGVAYLHAFKLSKFGLAPYAGGFGGRAVASLERSLQLRQDPVVMVVLVEAYVLVGAFPKFTGLVERMLDVTPSVPLK